MHRDRIARRSFLLLGSAVVCGPWFAGCGEETTATKTMTPDATPAEKGKDSMDFYRNQMMKGAKKAAPKK